jgi:hypothetical protein
MLALACTLAANFGLLWWLSACACSTHQLLRGILNSLLRSGDSLLRSMNFYQRCVYLLPLEGVLLVHLFLRKPINILLRPGRSIVVCHSVRGSRRKPRMW